MKNTINQKKTIDINLLNIDFNSFFFQNNDENKSFNSKQSTQSVNTDYIKVIKKL